MFPALEISDLSILKPLSQRQFTSEADPRPVNHNSGTIRIGFNNIFPVSDIRAYQVLCHIAGHCEISFSCSVMCALQSINQVLNFA